MSKINIWERLVKNLKSIQRLTVASMLVFVCGGLDIAKMKFSLRHLFFLALSS